jgi:hypothetical protein
MELFFVIPNFGASYPPLEHPRQQNKSGDWGLEVASLHACMHACMLACFGGQKGMHTKKPIYSKNKTVPLRMFMNVKVYIIILDICG